MTPSALVIRAPGTNRDHDVAFALSLAGASPRIVTMGELRTTPQLLIESQMLVFAGGFSHADSLGAGSLVGLEISRFLSDEIQRFVERGCPVLGICNGFQILVRSGLLPGSLTHNESNGVESAKGTATGFTCKWVTLAPVPSTPCVWTRAVIEPIECPIAHGEGRYVASPDIVTTHGALVYENGSNPNGSAGDIGGITDSTGLVLGLMPHPENHVLVRQHPRFGRGEHRGLGLTLFQGGVNHVVARG